MKIAICGSGPSALYAHLALTEIKKDNHYLEWNIHTVSEPFKPMGAMYLHWLPDWVISRYGFEPEPIYYRHYGSASKYYEKQWGDIEYTDSSFGDDRKELGYDPLKVYTRIMNPNNCSFIYGNIDELSLRQISHSYDLVFKTFLVGDEKAEASPYLVLIPISSGIGIFGANFIDYDGRDGIIVRMSNLFGRLSIEYSSGHITNIRNMMAEGFYRMINDIRPDVPRDLIPRVSGNVINIGRYAEMNRRRLSHEIYDIVLGTVRRYINDK